MQTELAGAVRRSADAREIDLLVIGTSRDTHIDCVLRELDPAVRVFRFNVDEFPVKVGLTYRFDEIGLVLLAEDSNGLYRLSSTSAVWFRRIGSPQVDSRISVRAHRAFVLGETEAALQGISAALQSATWLSPYHATLQARSKLLQLQFARECGLDVPDTVVTNVPKEARAFLEANSDAIYKTLHSPSVVYDDHRTLIYSRLVGRGDHDHLDQVQLAPCQFQAYVDKAYELRITYICGQFFPIRIYSQDAPEGRVDWRAAPVGALRYEVATLPEDVMLKLSHLLQRLGLEYGAIDMVVTPAGDYVFLEVNPHGAWLWLERIVGLPISKTIATALSQCALKHSH